jgi:hypothetical protein
VTDTSDDALTAAKAAEKAAGRLRREGNNKETIAAYDHAPEYSVSSLCPNCSSDKHARCCSWCGKIHRSTHLDREHCSIKCAKDAARTNKISDEMEQDAMERERT